VQGSELTSKTHNGKEEMSDILGELLDSKVEVSSKTGLDLFGDMDMTTNNNVLNNLKIDIQDKVVYKFSLVPVQQSIARTAKSAKGIINNVEIF